MIDHWRKRPEADYAISSIVELEVLYGVYSSPSPVLTESYQRILKGRFTRGSTSAKTS